MRNSNSDFCFRVVEFLFQFLNHFFLSSTTCSPYPDWGKGKGKEGRPWKKETPEVCPESSSLDSAHFYTFFCCVLIHYLFPSGRLCVVCPCQLANACQHHHITEDHNEHQLLVVIPSHHPRHPRSAPVVDVDDRMSLAACPCPLDQTPVYH